MNSQIEQLAQMSRKAERLIVGLMSGTSLDGLDVALCRIKGSGRMTQVAVEAFETVPYSDHEKEMIRTVFSKETVNMPYLCALNPWIGTRHADMVLECLRTWGVAPETIDCIASHGQTVYHAPRSHHKIPGLPNSTLQIGDGDHLAVRSGIVTLSDFRQKHIAAGGEGAPLAVYGDYLVFASDSEDRVLLNMGGIANITFLPQGADFKSIICSDVGPGNTMMDAYVQRHFEGLSFDRGGAFAASGEVQRSVLRALKDHPFFSLNMPKSTGPELFNLAYLDQALAAAKMEHIRHEDVLATLSRFSADMIVEALSHLPVSLEKLVVYASGGGAHNPVLMRNIDTHLKPGALLTTAEMGVDPDAKEAVLFALLANQSLASNTLCEEPGDTEQPTVSLGKISFPG